MSKITVTTIAGLTSGGDANKVKIDPRNTLHVPGHASIGVDAVDASRGLTVAGATDGSGSSALVVYNSSLASKFAVRDDGLTTITNNATVGGTFAVTGNSTANSINLGGRTLGAGGTPLGVNFSSATTNGMQINDTNSGNLGGMIGFYSGSGGGTNRANIQNANNAGIHVCVGTSGSVTFTNSGYVSANALDDYEEGQWTPNVFNAGNSSNWTTKKGDYIKIGKVVHCWFVCDHGNTNSGSGSGTLTLQGLPFSALVESTSGSTFAMNSTQSVGIWAANPSQQVGNLMTAGSATEFLLYMGGANKTGQLTFATGHFSYVAQ